MAADQPLQKGWSLQEQEVACRTYAEKTLGVSLPDVDVYREDGVSGGKKMSQRKVLQAILEGCKAGHYTHVLLHQVDRGARRLRTLLEVIDDLSEIGVVVVSVLDNKSTATASDIAWFQMVGMMAEWQRNRTGEQIKAMQHGRRREGLPTSPCPFGARYLDDGTVGPDDTPLDNGSTNYTGLQLAFAWRAEGRSFRNITGCLNAAGYRSTLGRLMNDASVAYMLSNRFYLGELRLNTHDDPQHPNRVTQTEWLPGAHTPLIAADLWRSVEAVNTQRSQHRQPVNLAARTYSFGSGTVRCLACLKRGTVSNYHIFHTSHQATWSPSIACSSRITQHVCTEPSVSLRVLDQQMQQFLSLFQLDTETRRELVSAYLEDQQQRLQVRNIKTEIAALQAKLRRLRMAFVEYGNEDERDDYERQRRTILLSIAELEQLQQTPQEADMYDLSAYLADLSRLWEDADQAQRARIVQALFSDIYLESRQIVAVRPRAEWAPLFATFSKPDQFATADQSGLENVLPSDAILLPRSLRLAQSRKPYVYLTPEQEQDMAQRYVVLLKAGQRGGIYAELARDFGVHENTVQRVVHDRGLTGTADAKRRPRPAKAVC